MERVLGLIARFINIQLFSKPFLSSRTTDFSIATSRYFTRILIEGKNPVPWPESLSRI
jgi:hypothetical protein